MSDKANDGGSAFPVADTALPIGRVMYGSNGMTLRDYFAGQALAGWLASYGSDCEHPTLQDTARNVAECSYAMADAMLREREAGGAKGAKK